MKRIAGRAVDVRQAVTRFRVIRPNKAVDGEGAARFGGIALARARGEVSKKLLAARPENHTVPRPENAPALRAIVKTEFGRYP